MEFRIFEKFPVKAAVSERTGGISFGAYASNNMSFTVGDDSVHVSENRRRFLSLLSINPESLVGTVQVHGTEIRIATKEDCGCGAFSSETAFPFCDGLLTKEFNVPLALLFADCTPIFLYDPVQKAVGIVHGGWRGTAGDICGKAVAMMEETFSSRPSDILAAIGPCIRRCCFEVGEDVIYEFGKLFDDGTMKNLTERNSEGKLYFDLPTANRLLLLRAGLSENHVEDSGICTFCHNDSYFSYRKAGGETGRHMGVIMMSDET